MGLNGLPTAVQGTQHVSSITDLSGTKKDGVQLLPVRSQDCLDVPELDIHKNFAPLCGEPLFHPLLEQQPNPLQAYRTAVPFGRGNTETQEGPS